MTAIGVYQRKPVRIEASDPITPENAAEIAAWCGGHTVHHDDEFRGVRHTTRFGELTAKPGWRLVKHESGFYPAYNPSFDEAYEFLGEPF